MIYVAEKWGIPPWEVNCEQDSHNARQTWYRRSVDYYNQINKKRQKELEKLNG